MSIFTDAQILDGESFPHALAPYDPATISSSEFSPSRTLSVVIEESGKMNVKESIISHTGKDPIDCVKVPEFSKKNKFVEGLEKYLTTIPFGGIILYSQGDSFRPPTKAPAGFVPCDGKSYFREDGTSWTVPTLPPVATSIYIQRLPLDVTRDENLLAIRPVVRRSF